MIRLGLTGWPLGHSFSPKLHNAALQVLGLDGEYNLYPVDPARMQDLQHLLERVRSGEILGVNVTIPHKQAVFELLDDLTAPARAISAVNTIYMQSDRLTGHNTDAPGFLADLNAKFPVTVTPGQAIVLGAGGSARAVAWSLALAGWHVTVAARRLEQAVGLVEALHINEGRLQAIDQREISLNTADLIVNATSVGMHPNVDSSPWPEGIAFPQRAIVYDLVYNPRDTLLVRQAREAGLRAVTGAGMLVEQAALAFEIWTGRPAPRAVMSRALEA